MRLVFTQELWDRMREIVFRTRLETGVSLFGRKDGEERIVKVIVDPGKDATHEYARYSGDADHATEAFDALRREDPSMEWLGELHAHPLGMTWLSDRDRKTVAEVLVGTDETYHPDEFIAGVIQRVSGSMVVYPVRFTKTDLEGEEMEVIYGTSILKEPEGTASVIAKAYRHCWSWQRRKRHSRHGGSGGNGQDHANRSRHSSARESGQTHADGDGPRQNESGSDARQDLGDQSRLPS
jgi:hypothetical protein